VRKIAHKYYMDRVHELYQAMETCQDQFRSVLVALSSPGPCGWDQQWPRFSSAT